MAVFGPDNKGGRPLGAKTKLTRRVFEDMLKVWIEPSADGVDVNRGTAALRTLFYERPAEFVRIVASVLPKDLVLEGMFAEVDSERLERTLALVQQLQAEQDDGEGQDQDGDSQGDGGGVGGATARH
jgi:hypothetical protein